MSSHVLSVTGFLPASPLAKGERIEVRGSLILIIKVTNPHPTLSLGKGEATLLR
jgi:hypothetical protein